MNTNTALKIGEVAKTINAIETMLQRIYNNKSFGGTLKLEDSNLFNVTKISIELTGEDRRSILESLKEILERDLIKNKNKLSKLTTPPKDKNNET